MIVSEKYNDFIDCPSRVDFLEGTTSAGKTTVGIFKFMLDVADSPHTQHILSGLDAGTIEKNIINKPHGILDEFGCLVEYKGAGASGEKLPHILFHTKGGDKKIYILGYGDKARWKKALGNQYGCLFVDEINIADMDFVREAFMRCDKVIATLNPDDPMLPIYSEYINHSRPLDKYKQDTPSAILEELVEEPRDGWRHWFFRFSDNIAITPEKIATIKANVPPGTKLYKNKIEGIRCKATGLVFETFGKNCITNAETVKALMANGTLKFRRLSLGVDTAYSTKSPDTIAMLFIGITTTGALYVLDERLYNNRDLGTPLAPSDVAREIVQFADFCRLRWGDFRAVFVDSADAATLMELAKYRREQGTIYQFIPAYKQTKVMDRINLQLGWITTGAYKVLEHCKVHIHELNTYSWEENKKEPEDRNDHTINGCQYAWLPYKEEIGI